MSVIVLNQTVVHYESLGRGRPVLFLHTWVGSWRYWVPCLQAAAVSHSAYALDLYGFGDTARDQSQYSLESQADLVRSFMDEMGIDRIAIVGHGLGAIVGLHFAAMHPIRIARIMAVGLPVRPNSVPQDFPAFGPLQLLAHLDPKQLHAKELLPETNAIDAVAAGPVPAAAQIESSLSTLRKAGIATLIINGENDPLRLPTTDVPFPDLGPQAHEIVIPESGHFPMLDAGDAFHRLMVDFLALEPGAGPRDLHLREEWRRRVR